MVVCPDRKSLPLGRVRKPCRMKMFGTLLEQVLSTDVNQLPSMLGDAGKVNLDGGSVHLFEISHLANQAVGLEIEWRDSSGPRTRTAWARLELP